VRADSPFCVYASRGLIGVSGALQDLIREQGDQLPKLEACI